MKTSLTLAVVLTTALLFFQDRALGNGALGMSLWGSLSGVEAKPVGTAVAVCDRVGLGFPPESQKVIARLVTGREPEKARSYWTSDATLEFTQSRAVNLPAIENLYELQEQEQRIVTLSNLSIQFVPATLIRGEASPNAAVSPAPELSQIVGYEEKKFTADRTFFDVLGYRPFGPFLFYAVTQGDLSHLYPRPWGAAVLSSSGFLSGFVVKTAPLDEDLSAAAVHTLSDSGVFRTLSEMCGSGTLPPRIPPGDGISPLR